jgi:ElaB/YqjD/DUF883 family membrane-anchored ribosome-binding protein
MDSNTDRTVDTTQPELAGRVIAPPTTKALPARVTRPSPQTVEEAREAVDLSRQRISTTLDALEARIVHGKHTLREKLDVRLQFREQVQRRPLAVVAVAAGLGMLLGSLGGGADDDSKDGDERRDLKKWRKQRKKRVRARLDAYGDDDDADDDSGGGLKRQLLSVVTSAITAAAVAQAKRVAVENLQQFLARHDDDDLHARHDLDDLDDLDDPDDRPRRRPRVRRVRRDPQDIYS